MKLYQFLLTLKTSQNEACSKNQPELSVVHQVRVTAQWENNFAHGHKLEVARKSAQLRALE